MVADHGVPARFARLHLVAAILSLAAALAATHPCDAAAGDLDPGFGADGMVVTSAAGSQTIAGGLARQADGKIVVAGQARPCDTCLDGFAAVRYLPDGALDTAFGDGGIAFVGFGDRGGRATDVTVAPDGGIVVAGTKHVGSVGRYTIINDFAVARLLPDGSLDPAFGRGGVATAHFGDLYSVAEAVLIQADGKVVVAGRSYHVMLFDDHTAVARFLPNGELDPEFGTGGVVSLGLAGSTYGAALQADGRIVLAGATSDVVVTSQRDLVMARLTVDGRLDESFGDGGYVRDDLDGRGDVPGAVRVLADGRLAVASYILGEGWEPKLLAVSVYLGDGSRDLSFGVAGIAKATSWGQQCVDGPALDVQPDGALIVAGERYFGVVRFDENGRIDETFAPDPTIFAARGDRACPAAVALEPGGAIVVAGSVADDIQSRILVARFEGQAPTLAATADRQAPDAGDTVSFRFAMTSPGYVTFDGASLTVTAPYDLTSVGPVVVDPPGAGRPGPTRVHIDDLSIAPARPVTVTVPMTVREDVPPGTPLAVEATLDAGPGHRPVAARVAIVTQGPPNTRPDEVLVQRGKPTRIDVLGNDSDPNGDPFHVIEVTVPRFGSATTDGATVTYEPTGGYVGDDAFAYAASDGHGTSWGEVTVHVVERIFTAFVPVAAAPVR